MRALLICTYDLGRQPFGLASPAAWLRRAGVEVECVDTSRDPLLDEQIGPADLVLDDIRAQVDGGAQHISFGDPDFFNGPTHARRIVERLHAAFPSLTY